MGSSRISRVMALTTTTLIAFVTPSLVEASEAPQRRVDLPAQDLSVSLRTIALLYGTDVLSDDAATTGISAPALGGSYTLEEALDAVLAGSGLAVQRAGNGFVVRRPADKSDVRGDGEEGIVVTGSRIRGARIASPTVTLDQQDLRDTGYVDLGQVARSLPQSFGGGQNPGVGRNVPQSVGQNVGASSSVNLRGLGSDATLTILNGRRMPYDGVFQGVDISAIPMQAVERLEVVADGASATYGSDAVAGVVNVILREDFDGLATRARVGGATDGGNFQQVYGAIAGSRWNGGGGFIAYEFNRNTELNSNDRSSTRQRPNQTLLPRSRRHALAAHIHQDVSPDLVIDLDGLYNSRISGFTYPLNPQADLDVSRADQSSRAYVLSLAGTASLALGPWQVAATSTFGRGSTQLVADYSYSGASSGTNRGRYTNRTASGELVLDGPLFALPGGDVRFAGGAGLRNTGYESLVSAASILNYDKHQNSRYAFGELDMPLLGPENDVLLVHRLDLSAALRYEDYTGVGDIATPKLGVVFAPHPAIELRATWGKSFRAPSFYDLYAVTQASVYPATRFGGTGYPVGSTAIFLQGGNPDLKPERASSWSATIALHPQVIPDASLEVSYFATRYVDRVVAPVTVAAQAFTNPAYAAQVAYDPGPDRAVAGIDATQFFFNYTGGAFDPASVVAIIDGRNTNVGRQNIRGVDVQARYRADLMDGQAVFNLNASYLESKQVITAGLPVEVLAGRIFGPAHWRARAGVTWDRGPVRIAATGSYISGVTDRRATTVDRIRGMTTLDVNARYRFPDDAGPLRKLEIGVTVENAFNAMPARIATAYYYDAPYDSTNYSAVGRVVALEVTKSW